VGVQSRNFSNARIYSLGWQPATSLRDGIRVTYHWIEQQVRRYAAAVGGSSREATAR
jgi:nucleoside-diphosphate-sugar epimerase